MIGNEDMEKPVSAGFAQGGNSVEHRATSGLGSVPLLFLLLSVSYVFVDFLLLHGNRLILFPFQHDDYVNLSPLIGTFSKLWPRPVSRWLIAWTGNLGVEGFYIVLNLLLIAYGALVILFLFQFLESKFSLAAVFLNGVLLFSIPSTLWWAKYTGLMTNLLSGCFGVLALLFLLAVSRRGRIWPFALLATFFYLLSIFSKEDFVLPPLLLAGYLALFGSANRQKVSAALVGILGSLGGLIVYNTFLIRRPFFGSVASGTYRIELSPASVVSTCLRYLRMDRYSLALLFGFLGAVIAGVAILARRRRSVVLIGAMTLSLIAPYGVLPGHVSGFYSFGWLAWMAASPFAVAGAILERFPRLGARLLLAAGAVAFATWAAWTTRVDRQNSVDWFQLMSGFNRNVVRSLIENKPAITREERVGVLGVSSFSPWTGSLGDYLVRRLGFHNKWLVFVSEDSPFRKIDGRTVIQGKAPITVLPLQDAASFGDLLFVQFNQEGRGTLGRGREALVRAPLTSARKRYILHLIPTHAAVGELFQRQPTGNAAISVLGEGFAPGDAVFWGSQRLETTLGSSKALSASVPPSLLLEARSVTVSVRDPDDPWRPELSAQFRVLPASVSQR
jgi:hypothetical protein